MNKRLKLKPFLSGFCVIAIAIVELLCLELLDSSRENAPPMALSTAISFLSLGIIQLVLNFKQLSRISLLVLLIITFLVSLFGLLEVIEYFMTQDLSLEDRLIATLASLNDSPVARMSPVTGATFFLAGMAIFLLILHPKTTKFNSPINYISGISNTLVLLISFVFCLAYLYKTPLLYGSGSGIPMPPTTTLGFLFLSHSILTSESNAFPINLITGTSTHSHLFRLILPLAIISTLVGGSSVLYLSQHLQINPAFIWATLTIVIIFVTSVVASFVAHYLGFKIDSANAISNKALRDSEQHLRLSQLCGKIGTWEADFMTHQEIWSEAVTKELGFPDIAEPKWKDFLATIYPDDREHVIKIINQHLYENKACDVDYRIVDTQGKIRWMNSVGKAEFDTNGIPLKLKGTVQDITVRKMAEEKLQLSAKVFSETREGIIITDAEGIIVDVNPAFCNMSGYHRAEAIGQNPRIFSSGKQSPEFYKHMWQTINKQNHWQGEVWNRTKEGILYAALLSISSILDEDGKALHYVEIFSDITHSKKQQETLEQIAHYDMLTKLPNRVLLADRFTHALAHRKRQNNLLAVCFLDLDDFKLVNDRYGHETGDKLLIQVAERIKANIRDEDTVSRQGGDEFVLLLGDIESLTQCEQMLKRFIESLALPYMIDQQSICVGASVGVTLFPLDNVEFDALMRHADQAMYQAKLTGRNHFHLFNAEQDQQTIQQSIQLKEIQQALLGNEFCLNYQPKVNMQTGAVFGAEALIRWIHPEKGLIAPLEFLSIIEETELEIKIGNWVINEALVQMGDWQAQGIELEVSVNISFHHLQSPSFVTDLETALALHPKIDSKCLQLELLESSALGDLQTINSIIKICINTLGVGIALDDFGTGYSSLTHLRNLAAKTIKIDQSFVRNILDDPDDYAIIDGVIGLANSFNRKVIAEGVETSEHGLMLLIMGCHKAQGYGIASPMPASDIPDWLNNYSLNQQWISCANKVRTLKENKVELLKLTLTHWQKVFVHNIQSSADTIEHWPISKRRKCHCGVWIQRAKQEHLFAESWLKDLDEAHHSMHNIADDLFNQYQQGETKEARAGLKDFQSVIEKISNILERRE